MLSDLPQTCAPKKRAAWFELPRSRPVAQAHPEMAFSGQYAAAQLEKLDNSPLFRGRSFSLARKISDFLGYAPHFAPPSFVRWARAHGRLPWIDDDVCDEYVSAPMLASDFNNITSYDAPVVAKFPQLRNSRIRLFEQVAIYADHESIRARTNAGQVLFGITLQVNVGYNDLVFCQR